MRIPKNWNDITVGQFQEYQKTLNEEPFDAIEEQSLLERRAMALTGWDQDQIDRLKITELYQINQIVNKPLPTKIPKRIRVAGKLYRVILDPTKEDAVRYKMVMNACKEKEVQLHRLMFSLCVPIKWWGKDIDLDPWEIQDRLNEFKDVPMTIANPIIVFFWTLSNVLTKDILQYSDQILTKMNKEVLTGIDSTRDMVG
jgi:hypothetical protein